jgi:transposase
MSGNKAETATLLPVIQAFQARHGTVDFVVVADAGMLSAANLKAAHQNSRCRRVRKPPVSSSDLVM